MRRFELVVAGAAALLFAGNGIARADDPKPAATTKPVDENLAKVMELEKQAKQHLADHADDASKKDCKEALELAGTLADAKLKTRCLGVIGLTLDVTNDNGVRRVAIKAIADSGEKSLYHFVTQYLKQPNEKVVPELIMDAIDCGGKLKADEAVQPMLDLEKTSDVYTVNVGAIKALSNYGDVKRWRVKILKDMVDDIRKDRPGVSYRWKGTNTISGGAARVRTSHGIRTGEESRTRYEALAGEVCAACNKLTGQNVASPEDWFDLVEKYKTNLEALWGGK